MFLFNCWMYLIDNLFKR